MEEHGRSIQYVEYPRAHGQSGLGHYSAEEIAQLRVLIKTYWRFGELAGYSVPVGYVLIICFAALYPSFGLPMIIALYVVAALLFSLFAWKAVETMMEIEAIERWPSWLMFGLLVLNGLCFGLIGYGWLQSIAKRALRERFGLTNLKNKDLRKLLSELDQQQASVLPVI